MKRSDLGIAALGGLVVASGCSPQNRTSFEPSTGAKAVGVVAQAANTTRIAAMTFDDVTIGTLMKFMVYHDRSDVITVSASDPDMTDIKTVKNIRTQHTFR